jgi:hypothetical protein
MNKLRTMRELVQEKVDAWTALQNNPGAALEYAMGRLKALQRRFEEDPALNIYSNLWAEETQKLLAGSPAEMHPMILQQIIAQLILEWDGIKDAYNGQFQTTP